MSGILSKSLFTISKYNLRNAKVLTINFKQFLRAKPKEDFFLKTKQCQSNRNYVKLFNRVNQVASKPTETPVVAEVQGSIFKRFKDAYRKHGKVLLYIHFSTCICWIIGFYFLAKR